MLRIVKQLKGKAIRRGLIRASFKRVVGVKKVFLCAAMGVIFLAGKVWRRLMHV